MNKNLTLNDVVLGNLRRRGKQNALLVLGVTLAIFFLSVSLFSGSCILASYSEFQKNKFGEANIVILNVGEANVEELRSMGLFSEYAIEECLYESVGDPENLDDDFPIARAAPEVVSITRTALWEGELPDEPGEIAIESAAMTRMRLQAQVGDRVTLTLACFDGENMQSDSVEKTFTLVGILKNKGSAVNDRTGTSKRTLLIEIAEAFVSPDEPIVPGTRPVKSALGVRPNGARYKDIFDWCERNLNKNQKNEYFLNWVYQDSLISGGGDALPIALAVGIVCVALTFVAMTGIASALTSSIDKRKSQIGMLRAIGATGTQIRKLLLRETLTIALLTLPLGVGLSLFLLFAASRLFSEFIVFSVPVWMIAADIAACGLCVALSSLLPLRRSTKITPMQAVRDVDLTRNFRWTEKKSKERFVPQRLLAKRNNSLRPGRTFAHTALVAVGALLFTVAFAVCGNMLKGYVSESIPPDYEVVNFSGDSETLINERFYTSRLTDADVSEIASLPYVSRVDVTKEAQINILSDHFTEYATGGGYFDEYGYLSPEPTATEKALLESGWYLNTAQRWDEIVVNSQKLHERYRMAMKQLGWEGDALFVGVLGVSQGLLEKCEGVLSSGRIDTDKLATGEEVLLQAPKRYGVRIDLDASGNWYGMSIAEGDKITPEYESVYENDMFSAGDELRLGFAWTRLDLNDSFERLGFGMWDGDESGGLLPDEYEAFTRTVKIGGMLDENVLYNRAFGSGITVVTSLSGLAALGIDANIIAIDVFLSGEPDEETRAYIAESIEAVVSRSSESRFFDRYETARENRRIDIVVTATCATLLTLLFAFTWALINSAVAGRVQSEVRQIGTMRAVGASKRAVFASYASQLLSIFWTGGLIGWALSVFGVWFALYQYRTALFWTEGLLYCLVAPLYLLPLFGLCCLGLRAKLKPVFRSSVVENIRIL